MGQVWNNARRPAAVPACENADRGRTAVASFSTGGFAAARQFDAYRDWMADLAEMRRPDPERARDGFAARQTIRSFGPLRLVHEVCDPVEGQTRGGRSLSAPDHWVLAFHLAGDTLARSDDLVRRTPPGGLAFASLARPIALRQEASETWYLFIPRDALPGRAAELDRLHNRNLEAPFAGLLASHMRALETALTGADAATAGRLAKVTLGLLTGCLLPDDGLSAARTARERALRERALRHIRRGVGSPLTPADLCAALGVSRTSLYRLFRNDGGIGRAILAERLAAARAALIDPWDRRRIGEVARDYGFGSTGELSRAFRRAFGCPPSDVYLIGTLPGSPEQGAGLARAL